MIVDEELNEAVASVWRILPPGPDNLLSSTPFRHLAELCAKRYGGARLAFSLSTALRSLGLPCELPPDQQTLALDAETAVRRLDASFSKTTTCRVHLCPLDFADDLPDLSFGPARVTRFNTERLGQIFDAPRLARYFPADRIDLDRLAQLKWLVVEEAVAIDPRPEARAAPFLFSDMREDSGAFDAHQARYPVAVERALFFLLLAPWEVWTTMDEVNWRGFTFPWIYTVDADLAVRPQRPPDADALAFEPKSATDVYGDQVEWEGPVVLPLREGFRQELSTFDQTAWDRLEAARATALLQTPIEHFLVRAYAAGGIDELMAHMTAIEAAVGEEADHRRKLRGKPDPHPTLSPSDRVASRVAGLLKDPTAHHAYSALFDLRSEFIHGRAGIGRVSTAQKIMARGLARRVAAAVVAAADTPPPSRATFLANLLDRGCAMAPAKS